MTRSQDVTGALAPDVAIQFSAGDTQVVTGRLDGATVVESTIDTSIRHPHQAVSCGALRDVVILGDDASGSSVLELLRWQGAAVGYTAAGAMQLGGDAWTGVAWSESAQGFLLLDNQNGRLAFLAFLPGGPLAGTPTDLIAQGAWPALADDRERRLSATDLGGSAWKVIAYVPEEDWKLTETSDALAIERKTNGDLVTTVEASGLGRISILEKDVIAVSSTAIDVKGPANTEVRVLRLASPDGPSSVLGAAMTDLDGRASVLVSGIQVADVLVAETPLLPWSRGVTGWTFAEHRIGTADTLPNGLHLRVGPQQPGAVVGRQLYSVRLLLDHPQSGAIATPVSYPDVTLIVGSGPQQIGTWNGRPVLIGDLFFGTDGAVDAPYRSGRATVRMPIPDDPALDGFELWCQWVVVDGGNSYLSEIIGVRIQGSAFASMGALQSLQRPSNSLTSDRDRRRRARRWLVDCGAQEFDRKIRRHLFPRSR